MPTHYEVLGVAAGADTGAIRRAYIAVAKANHPDGHQRDDTDRRALADQRMRAANQAWHVLRDRDRRAEYDRTLRGAGSTSRPRPAPGASGRAGPSAAARAASAGRATSSASDRPAAPSGIVVPAAHAFIWRYAPIVVVAVVLVGLLVFSAYATSNDPSSPVGTASRSSTPDVGECVLVAVLSNGRVPVPVACGTAGSYRIDSQVDTPRPCPTGTIALALSDQKTTLCLVSVT